MEYFNEWVYAMCALRGGSFCDSARGTCTLISCTGMPGLELRLLFGYGYGLNPMGPLATLNPVFGIIWESWSFTENG